MATSLFQSAGDVENMSGDYVRAGVLVAVVVTAAAFAGLTTAATSGSIEASPNDAGATATHTVTATVDSDEGGSSWNGLAVHYEATDVSNVGQNDLVEIRIERGNSSESIDVSDDVSSVGSENNGQTLNIGLGGVYDLYEGDQIVATYDGAQNPDAGDYGVGIRINPQSSSAEASATLSISSDTTATQTATATATATPTATTTDSGGSDTTAIDSNDGDTSGGSDTTTSTSGGSDTTATTATSDSSDEDNGTSDIVSWASVDAEPAEPNANATHTVIATVDNETAGDSWNGLAVDYSGTGTNVDEVGQGDVVKIGIDRGGDAGNDTIDVNVSDDLSSVDASNDGQTLTVGLGGNYDLQYGDEVVVVYEDVQNPSEGIYQVPLDVNHQSSGGTGTAPFVLLTDDETTETATPNTETSTPTDVPTTTAESTPSTSPGFGTVAAVVALAAAALLARR